MWTKSWITSLVLMKITVNDKICDMNTVIWGLSLLHDFFSLFQNGNLIRIPSKESSCYFIHAIWWHRTCTCMKRNEKKKKTICLTNASIINRKPSTLHCFIQVFDSSNWKWKLRLVFVLFNTYIFLYSFASTHILKICILFSRVHVDYSCALLTKYM